MSFDAEDRKVLFEMLTLTKETRQEIRDLSAIVAREVSPLGLIRADIIKKLEKLYNLLGEIRLEFAEHQQWRKEHEEHHRRLAANGGE